MVNKCLVIIQSGSQEKQGRQQLPSRQILLGKSFIGDIWITDKGT